MQHIIKGRNCLLLSYKFPLCSFGSWIFFFFLVEPSVHLTLTYYIFISHFCCILGEFPHDLACYNEWNGNDFSKKNTTIKKKKTSFIRLPHFYACSLFVCTSFWDFLNKWWSISKYSYSLIIYVIYYLLLLTCIKVYVYRNLENSWSGVLLFFFGGPPFFFHFSLL